jgi:hypothetical protein
LLYRFSLGLKVKPTAPIDYREAQPRRRAALLVEQNFQSGGREPFGRAMFGWTPGEPSRKRSLYRMSGDYFQREMHREFFLEAIAFAIIVIISAWPLTTMVLMLLRLIQ